MPKPIVPSLCLMGLAQEAVKGFKGGGGETSPHELLIWVLKELMPEQSSTCQRVKPRGRLWAGGGRILSGKGTHAGHQWDTGAPSVMGPLWGGVKGCACVTWGGERRRGHGDLLKVLSDPNRSMHVYIVGQERRDKCGLGVLMLPLLPNLPWKPLRGELRAAPSA